MRVIDWISNLLAILAGICLSAAMVAIVANALLREFGMSPRHVFSLTEFGLLFIVMAASPWLVRVKGHVFIELLTAALPEKTSRIYSRGVAVLCIVICLVLAYYAWSNAMRSYKFGDVDERSFEMPKALLLGSMTVCFGLMAANFLRFIIGKDTLHTGQAGVHE